MSDGTRLTFKVIVISVVLVAGAMALTGCTSVHTASVTKGRVQGAADSGKAITITPTPSREPETAGLARETRVAHADTTPGPVTASGTVTIPRGQKGTTVQITVSWVNAATATQLASASQTLTGLTPGKPAAWSVSTILPQTTAKVTVAVRSVIPG